LIAVALWGVAVAAFSGPVQAAPVPSPAPSAAAPRRAAPAAPSFATLSAKAEAARTAGRLEEAAGYYEKALRARPEWHEGA
jgi:hypothetical protein